MAGTVLTAQVAISSGVSTSITPNYQAAAAQMEMPNNAPTLLHVKNGSGSSINVTATNQTTTEGAANADRVIAVPAGQERIMRFSPAVFNMSNGNVQLAFSATTTVTVGVYQAA